MGWMEQAQDALRALAALGAGTVAAALLFSLLAPALPLADSVAHFRLHLLGALTVAAVVAMVLGAPRIAVGSLAVGLLVGLVGLRPALPSGEARAAARASLTLLQLNLRYDNPDHGAVLALVAREQPDLIAFQEVSRHNMALLDALHGDYPHQQFCRFANVGGVAVLSRLAPVGGEDRGCAAGSGLAWLRVATPDGPVTAASLHLHWPYPYRQHEQVGRLTPVLEALPRPVLLGGDFNAAPWSHSADRVARAAGARVLDGLRFTFHRRFLPMTPVIGIPIDHVLVDPSLAPVSVEASAPVGSDHRAVVARLVKN